MNDANTINRHAGVLDVAVLGRAHIVKVGIGRALGAAQILASSNVGSFFIIDPQTVDAENVGQSAYEQADIGRSKVAAAKDRLLAINPLVRIDYFIGKAQNYTHLLDEISRADLVIIGVDDPRSMFDLADISYSLGVDCICCGTSGNNEQWFVSGSLRYGYLLRDVLPEAWRGIENGYKPPSFFPSCRLHAEALNVQTARIAIGLLHHRAGSSLPLAMIGDAFVKRPLVIGSNSLHEPSGFLTPARFVDASPIN